MNKRSLSAILAAIALSQATALPARAQSGAGQMSGSRLLKGLAGVAQGLAQRDAGLGRSADAANWQAWAQLYAAGAQALPPTLSAAQMTALNAAYCDRLAGASESRGAAPLGRFYRASSTMWRDLTGQIARGGQVIVRFPDELLRPIPGAPGTPWERVSAPSPLQPGGAAPNGAQALAALRAQASNRSATAPFSGDAAGLINRLNSMSQADVNALMAKGSPLDQFTPYWLKKAPGGNVLAQFGIGNGLMGTLGTRDINRILNPAELERIQPKLRQAQILGNLAGGMAAERKVRNEVQKYDYRRSLEKDAEEKLKQLFTHEALRNLPSSSP